MLIDVFTKDGQQAGQMELSDAVFAIEPSEHAMHLAVVAHLASRRQGNAKTKIRSEVSGGGKKPWRQKGRGTARAGSTRSPIWVGGGTIHGPKPHQFNVKLTKKLKQLARKSAFSLRAAEENMIVVEDFSLEQIKTKELYETMKNLKLNTEKTLVLLTSPDDKVYFSSRNIPDVTVYPAEQASTYDILRHKKIVLFRGAVEKIENALK